MDDVEYAAEHDDGPFWSVVEYRPGEGVEYRRRIRKVHQRHLTREQAQQRAEALKIGARAYRPKTWARVFS